LITISAVKLQPNRVGHIVNFLKIEKIDSRNLTNSRGMTYQSDAAFVPKKIIPLSPNGGPSRNLIKALNIY
jgi:hypothetical protein